MTNSKLPYVLLAIAMVASVAFIGFGGVAAQEDPSENRNDTENPPEDANTSDDRNDSENPPEDSNASENRQDGEADEGDRGNSSANPPAFANASDRDGDGQAEDVNGDNASNAVDTQALFADLPDAAAENSPRFDFNEDGSVDVVDVQSHFQTEA